MFGNSFFRILFFGITIMASYSTGNILLSSFRMDTGMHSGTYWLRSGNIACVPEDVYKNYIF
jgi:hypothetical protein